MQAPRHRNIPTPHQGSARVGFFFFFLLSLFLKAATHLYPDPGARLHSRWNCWRRSVLEGRWKKNTCPSYPENINALLYKHKSFFFTLHHTPAAAAAAAAASEATGWINAWTLRRFLRCPWCWTGRALDPFVFSRLDVRDKWLIEEDKQERNSNCSERRSLLLPKINLVWFYIRPIRVKHISHPPPGGNSTVRIMFFLFIWHIRQCVTPDFTQNHSCNFNS